MESMIYFAEKGSLKFEPLGKVVNSTMFEEASQEASPCTDTKTYSFNCTIEGGSLEGIVPDYFKKAHKMLESYQRAVREYQADPLNTRRERREYERSLKKRWLRLYHYCKNHGIQITTQNP